MRLEKLQRWGKKILPGLGLALLPLALFVLYRELRNVGYDRLAASFHNIPMTGIVLGVVLTLANYAVLTGYDLMGLRFIKRSLNTAKACMASFVGFAFSNSVGLFFLSSGMVRLGLYTNWGLSAGEVGALLAFNSITFLIGLILVGGGMLLFGPALGAMAGTPWEYALRGTGALLLASVAVYLWFCFRRKPLKVLAWEIPVPSPGMAVAQLIISIVDWALAAGVLYVLLPEMESGGRMPFLSFFGIFMLAQMAGVACQMPGGLGGFDATILALLRQFFPDKASLFGPLVVYRGIYYLLPLVIAAVLLTTHTLVGRRKHFQQLGQVLGMWMPVFAPPLFMVGVFVSGVVLFFSGALPAAEDRIAWLREILPLSVIETSHFLSGIAGIALVFLARGLQLRLKAAYWLSLVLLTAGIPLTMLRGLDYVEASVLAVSLLAMLPCRTYFQRRTSLAEERFPWGWVFAIVLVVVSAGWLGGFALKHVEYRDLTWWQFALKAGDAPRFLRVMVGVSAVSLCVGLWRFMRPAKPAPKRPGPAELARATAVIQGQSETHANLALLGDKPLFFSEAGDAFLMYGIAGGSWVALGDPVGNPDARRELAWKYREMCELHNGRCVFYEVDRERLQLYLDLGLTPLKIGEEARIPLAEFTLAGEGWEEMRALCGTMERDGVAFEVVPATEVAPLLPELRRVSDAWLAAGRKAAGQGFTSGVFDEAYLKRFPLAVLRRSGGVIAFANIWATADRHELSVDLLRCLPGAPDGTMDYLFIRLMQWGREQGYGWFNMGMSPLSGEEARPLTPEWAAFGELIYRHGEHFYNFDGLRRYKAKFRPVWKAKYLAYPGRLPLPRVLRDVAALVAGVGRAPAAVASAAK